MLLRAKLAVVVAAALLLLAVAGTARAAGLTQAESRLIDFVNHARVAHGLRPLHLDWSLEAAARAHSAEMLRTSSFEHGNFFGRVRSFGASGPVYGENIAWGTGSYASPALIVREWLASPLHRANMLRPGFRRIGIGAVGGRFAGMNGALVVTADFSGN
jgi:uncharacterized protein YkwD